MESKDRYFSSSNTGLYVWMNEYRKRVSRGRRAAASNSSSHSRGMLAVLSWFIPIFLTLQGPDWISSGLFHSAAFPTISTPDREYSNRIGQLFLEFTHMNQARFTRLFLMIRKIISGGQTGAD